MSAQPMGEPTPPPERRSFFVFRRNRQAEHDCHVAQVAQVRREHPLGANSFLAKAGEHMPLIADGLVCLHKYRGQTEAEERARAFSLQKHLSKDGALVKLAELLPGSNLIASAVLDLQGHHKEAQECLDLLQNWRNFGSADGALTKVAEMLPGVDVIAFGVHVNAGNFAHALRSIAKTRWTDVTGDATITFDLRSLAELAIKDLQVSNCEVLPVASFMYGGLLDMAINLIEVNSIGQSRSRFRWRRVKRVEAASSKRRNPMSWAKDRLVASCNDTLSGLQDTVLEMVPHMVECGVTVANRVLRRRRRESWLYWLMLPKALPKPPPQLDEELQLSILRITAAHRTAAPPQPVGAAAIRPGRLDCAAACTLCLGCGLHSAGLACLSGCFLGAAELGRCLRRRFAPILNRWNAQAWSNATKEPNEVFRRRSSESSAEPLRLRLPLCVVAELEGEQAERVVASLCDYVWKEVPLAKLLGRTGLSQLTGLLASCVGCPVVPVVVDLEVSEGLYSVGGETLWLPSFPLALILKCHLERRPFVSSVQVAVTDEIVDQILDVVQTELRSLDLRALDPRLAGFVEPINLQLQAMLSWPHATTLRLDLQGIKVHLRLPA
ncbi:unnamed protein product [Effrenium voratum]|uniref:Uncharacterized protein n=1 Tax=Effrenium voratum TaxID=2562239 RepID=A0AA36JCG6_9DINO|nr:unnamed protein product [Effrenium voratum]CAJ1445412.1 unnamed protein product [Effrenium voratum]